MTLQQLKYVTTIANIGSISEAAKRLFVSQPSLTKAIKELEKEMGITIFDRTNKGITVSKEGERFLGYARQVLEQAALLEEQYKSQSGGKKQFSVSTQHYSFAVNAFVELLKGAEIDQYDVSLRETQTYEIIDDVAHMKSEIGLLYYNDFNRPVLEKLIHTNELTFTELFTAHPHIFIGKTHPLAHKEVVSMDELEEYPYISFLPSIQLNSTRTTGYPRNSPRFTTLAPARGPGSDLRTSRDVEPRVVCCDIGQNRAQSRLKTQISQHTTCQMTRVGRETPNHRALQPCPWALCCDIWILSWVRNLTCSTSQHAPRRSNDPAPQSQA